MRVLGEAMLGWGGVGVRWLFTSLPLPQTPASDTMAINPPDPLHCNTINRTLLAGRGSALGVTSAWQLVRMQEVVGF